MNPTLQKYLLHILEGQLSGVQVLIFALNSLRKAVLFVKFGRSPTIWERGKKGSLSHDKQHDLVFNDNYFLNYKVFPKNRRYHSSILATLQF